MQKVLNIYPVMAPTAVPVRSATFPLPDVNRKRSGLAVSSQFDPLLTSLVSAFKTAFERLSGSNVFGLMPDPSFVTFARLLTR